MTTFNVNDPFVVSDSTPLNVLGTQVHLFADGGQTSGQFDAYRCVVPPHVGPPPHRHEAFDEAFYVVEGTFELVCGTETHRVKAGAYAFVPRGATHTFRNVGEETGVLLCTASPAGHADFFRDADGLTEPLTLESVLALCERHGIEVAGQ